MTTLKQIVEKVRACFCSAPGPTITRNGDGTYTFRDQAEEQA